MYMKSMFRLLASQIKGCSSAIKVIAAVWFLMSQAPALTAQDLTGTTEGVFSVSPAGAFNYTIPIKILDGYSNYSPQISLVYNSQGINGMVGMGWGLSSLSSITAVGHNRYYDGSDISGVSVSRNDAYSIDGLRLLPVSGTNWEEGAHYTTEEESWSLISVDSSFATTPKSFLVKSADGSIRKYGSDTGVFRYPNPDGDSAIGWLIDYQEDIDGNYIEYAYSYKDGIPYISEIRYGGNRLAGVLPGHVITFAYEARPDTFARSIKTVTYLCTQRLKSIVCDVNGNEYRRYTLTYDNTSYYSHLVTVKEAGAAGAAYPELTFEWNGFPSLTPSAANVTVDESVLYTPSKSYYISGDVDNDGVSELVSITPRPLQEANSVVRVYKKSGGTFALDGSYTASGHYEWSGLISSALRGGLLAHIGSAQSNSIVVPVLRTDIDGNHLIRFDLPMEGYSYQNILSYTDEIPAYTIADFDKDGKDEVIYVEKKGVGDNKISLVKIDFDTSAQSASDSVTDVSVSSCGNGNIRDCLSADFDGDGLADLLVLLDDCGVVLWNDNGVFGSYTSLSNIKYADTMQPCDINRDGKTETRTYNKYGEIKAKTSVTQATATTSASYIYDNKHQLINVYSGNIHTAYTYDDAGRPTVSRVEVADPDNANYTYYIQTSYLYDGPDRVIQTTSAMDDAVPTLVERYGYSNGWETGVWLNNRLVWKLESETDMGKVYSSSNGIRRTLHTYDNNGRLTSYAAFRIPNNSSPYAFSHDYTYNEKGFPTAMDGKTLAYGAYNRLSTYNGQNYTYDFKGNITISGAQGSVSYDGYKLQGVTSPNTAVWGTSERTIRTNGNKQPYMISQSDTTAVFHYDADWNRTSMSVYTGIDLEDSLDADGNLTEHPSGYSYNRIYCGDRYEVYRNSRFAPIHYYYVGGTPETAYAVAEISMGIVHLSYIYRDIQGSVTELMDSIGNVTHFYYDPWGRQCDSSHTPYANGYNNGRYFIRGYLSQEYYAEFGLQNLNARLYSPHIGRFLSPDPLIDTTGDVFGFNPYIYGRNNPCVYVDPDGRFPWLIVGAAAIGGTINLALNRDKADNFWKGLGFFSIGAGMGALLATCPAGVGVMEGVSYGILSGALGGGIAGGLNALISGEDVGNSICSGACLGALSGGVFGGIRGAINAGISGRNLWNGGPSGKPGRALEALNKSDAVESAPMATQEIPDIDPRTQNHHIVSPINKRYLPEFTPITDKYALSLKGKWNIEPISVTFHNGRHPYAYHKWILDQLKNIDAESKGDKEIFLKLFQQQIKEPLLKQPEMLGKDYWLNQ